MGRKWKNARPKRRNARRRAWKRERVSHNLSLTLSLVCKRIIQQGKACFKEGRVARTLAHVCSHPWSVKACLKRPSPFIFELACVESSRQGLFRRGLGGTGVEIIFS